YRSSCFSSVAAGASRRPMSSCTSSIGPCGRRAAPSCLASTSPARFRRIEPALDRAIALAGGLGIIVWKAKYWALSDKGRELLDNLQSDELVLVREKRLLEALPKPLTQTAVAALFQRTP